MSSESFAVPEKCRNCLSLKARIYTLNAAIDNSANAPEMVATMCDVGDGLAKLNPEEWDSVSSDMELYMDAVTAEKNHWDNYVELGKASLTTMVNACLGSVTRQDVDIEGLDTGNVEVYSVQVTDCSTPAKAWNDYDLAMQAYLDGE